MPGSNVHRLPIQQLKNSKSTKSSLIQKLLRQGLYLPCPRECTANYLKAVLRGQKKVFKNEEIRWIGNIPKFSELATSKIYDMVKTEKKINDYLPEYGKKDPERDFLRVRQ